MQVVDLKVPPDSSWERQHTDMENDLIHFTCPITSPPPFVRLYFRPKSMPKWVFDNEGYVRFEWRKWDSYPFEDSLVIAFRGPLVWGIDREVDTIAKFLVELVGQVDDTGLTVLESVEIDVEPVVGDPVGLGPRPWCRFVWREELEDDSVAIHEIDEYLGYVYEYNGISLPGKNGMQVVDMQDPKDDVVNWSCRHRRPARLDLVARDPVPDWAQDRFSIEYGSDIAPDPSKPLGERSWVVAFQEPLDWDSALPSAFFWLRLADTVNAEKLDSAELQVVPGCQRINKHRVATKCIQW